MDARAWQITHALATAGAQQAAQAEAYEAVISRQQGEIDTLKARNAELEAAAQQGAGERPAHPPEPTDG
jgi:cell division protein FtsB